MKKSEAIEKAGSLTKLAEILGISVQAVSKWPGNKLPPLRVYELKAKKPRWFRVAKAPAASETQASA